LPHLLPSVTEQIVPVSGFGKRVAEQIEETVFCTAKRDYVMVWQRYLSERSCRPLTKEKFENHD